MRLGYEFVQNLILNQNEDSVIEIDIPDEVQL